MAESESDKSSRTEEATEKRKSEARRDGQVAISRDVSTAAVLIGGVGFLAIGVPIGLRQLTDVTRHGLSLSFDETFWKALTVEHIHTHYRADQCDDDDPDSSRSRRHSVHGDRRIAGANRIFVEAERAAAQFQQAQSDQGVEQTVLHQICDGTRQRPREDCHHHERSDSLPRVTICSWCRD